jgi:hypothetical protein
MESSMKLTLLVLIGALAVGGYAQAQGQPPTLPKLPAPPSPPWAQKETITSACREEAQRLCSGKQGQDAANCLKNYFDKSSGKCQEDAREKQQ